MIRVGTLFALTISALGLLLLPHASAHAADQLHVGVLKLASSGPIFIALDKKYFADAGVDVALDLFDAAQPVAVATVSGDVDVGVTGLTAGFYNLAGKGALKIIGAQSREERGYHLIAYLASNKAWDAGLHGLKDLPGHKIAITQVGSTFHYSLGLIADKLGFPLSSVTLVPLQSMPNMATALAGNQVDAALIPATIAVPLIEKGEAHGLGWVGDETPWQLGAIFTSGKTIATRRAALTAFIAGYRRAAHDFYATFLTKGPDGKIVEGPMAPELLAIIAAHTGEQPDAIRRSIPYIDPDAKLLVDDIYHQVAWYQAQKLVDAAVDAKTILDLSFTGDVGKP